MLVHFRPAFVLLVLFTLLTGLVYPLAVTGVAQAVMPKLANGSMIQNGNTIIGSELIGQNFTDAKYFHGRPSATSAPDPADSTKTVDAPYNAANSSGSNLGPTSKKLIDRVKGDVEQLRSDGATGSIPADSVTASASGLDPHISPANASGQIQRVANARGIRAELVESIVNAHIEGRTLGIFGEPRVNVLRLNLALDAMKP
ncbi:MAG: potassium-transporting ATPase subunit KdpC [Afipia sp.]|nr:potassium-transporting ATPase subunit KdpC [Afipia sp.]